MNSIVKSASRPNGTKIGKGSNLDSELPQLQISPDPILQPVLRSFRELAEASATPAIAALQDLTAARKNLTDAVQESCATASESLEEYSFAAIELARNNMRCAFDLASAPGERRSISDVISVSHAQTKRQFDALLAMQTGLWRLACKVSTRTINPLLEVANTRDR